MTFRFASVLALTGHLFLAPACQPEQAAPPAPTLPLPPPPRPTPAPEPPRTNYLAPGFTGLYFIPGQPLVLAEGSSVFVDVNWVGGDGYPSDPFRFHVVSSAPANELSVVPSTVEVGPRIANAGAVLVSAIADDRADETPATYTLEVQPEGPPASGWAYDFSRAKLEVTIVEAERSTPVSELLGNACSRASLQAAAHSEVRDAGSWMRAVHGDDLTSYFSGEVLLGTSHAGTSLSLLAPYRRPFAYREEEGGPPLYRPYPFGFLFDLDVRETGNGYEAAMNLAWFDDLHVRLETPGCDALEAVCEDAVCRVR